MLRVMLHPYASVLTHACAVLFASAANAFERDHVAAGVLYVLGMFRGRGDLPADVEVLEHVQTEQIGNIGPELTELVRHAERIGAGGISPPDDAFWAVRAQTDALGLDSRMVMTLAKSVIRAFSEAALAARAATSPCVTVH